MCPSTPRNKPKPHPVPKTQCCMSPCTSSSAIGGSTTNGYCHCAAARLLPRRNRRVPVQQEGAAEASMQRRLYLAPLRAIISRISRVQLAPVCRSTCLSLLRPCKQVPRVRAERSSRYTRKFNSIPRARVCTYRVCQ